MNAPNIWVGVIEHKHGTNQYAASTEAGLWAQLAGFCREWWDRDGPDYPIEGRSDEDIVGCYFDWQAAIGGSESYSKSEVFLDLCVVLNEIAKVAVSPEGTLLEVCDLLEKAGYLHVDYALVVRPAGEAPGNQS
jgi:hypothetical protein